MSDDDVPAVLELLRRNALGRAAELLLQRAGIDVPDREAVTRVHFEVERRKVRSIATFAALDGEARDAAMKLIGHP